MPDVAREGVHKVGKLDWVGMDNIEIPIHFENAPETALANVNAYVNLRDANAKGIHMSRLYLLIDQKLPHSTHPLALELFLDELINSHNDLSDCAKVEIFFDFLTRRKSLKSNHQGWKKYPLGIIAKKIKGQFSLELSLEVLYSSTCPCSAALARQLIQEQFKKDFFHHSHKELPAEDIVSWLGSEAGMVATPHSQRSVAELKIKFEPGVKAFAVLELINSVEEALGTPVQTVVKREDEQAFAYLNGQNPMFCEDACRKIDGALKELSEVADYYIKVKHLESLHPHDAVSSTTKGVVGGYGS